MSNDATVKGYAEWKNWDKSTQKSTRFSWRFKYANKHIVQPLQAMRASHVCELGAGSGRLSNYLARLGMEGTAVDIITPPTLDSRIKFVLGDATSALMNMEAESFHAVLAIDMLEHVPRDDMDSLLEQIYDKLKPEGLLMIQVPNAGSPMGLAYQEGDWTHITRFSSSSINQLLLSKRFEVLRNQGAPLPIMPVSTLLARPAYWICSFFWKMWMTSVGVRADVLPPNLFVVARKPSDTATH
ncbi:MAG: class I SAM-dependent methyltransferase [Pseudomonadota bacterium]